MKPLETQNRPLTLKETKTIQKKIRRIQREMRSGDKTRSILISLVTGLVCAALAIWTRYDLLAFAFGTIGAFAFVFVVITPFEIFKERRKLKKQLTDLDEVLRQGSVDTCLVSAKRIAVAKEHEDEGDLYIIEISEKEILFLHDLGLKLRKFPCLQFEVYSDRAVEVFGRQVNPQSEKIKPIIVDAKAKRNYFRKAALPGNLTVERKRFDVLLEKMNKSARKEK